MDDLWQCWRCGADLGELPRPYGRYARCPTCRADLHVCLMCRHYDTSKARQCREPAADEVKDKTRANFCEWYQARVGSHPSAIGDCNREHRRALDTLFDSPGIDSDVTASSARKALDDLFSADG